MHLLEVRDLAKSFGGVRAVDRVSFQLEAGELLALIGPNGAGKSTCFNLLNGQLPPDGGSVALDGRDVTGRSPRDDLADGRGAYLSGYGDVRLDERARKRADGIALAARRLAQSVA